MKMCEHEWYLERTIVLVRGDLHHEYRCMKCGLFDVSIEKAKVEFTEDFDQIPEVFKGC